MLTVVLSALHSSYHHAGRLTSHSAMSSPESKRTLSCCLGFPIRYEGKDGATEGRHGLCVFMHRVCLWCDVHLGNNG